MAKHLNKHHTITLSLRNKTFFLNLIGYTQLKLCILSVNYNFPHKNILSLNKGVE